MGAAGAMVGGVVALGGSFIYWGGTGYDRTTVTGGATYGYRKAKMLFRSKLRKNLDSVTGSNRRLYGSIKADVPGVTGSNRRVIGSAGRSIQISGGENSFLPVGFLH